MKLFYKIFLLIFSCTVSLLTMGQNLNIVNPITITIPNNPPANTEDWARAVPQVMLMAQSKPPAQNGTVQARVLVTIKKGGSKICGDFTAQTAPMHDFDPPVKIWTGAAMLSLLGNTCTLPAGDYELCVQFYDKSGRALLGQNCKPFTIKESKQENYAPPQNVMPANDKKFITQEAKGIFNFRWTPVVPKPKESIIYRLKVWQLMQGQNAAAAIRSNQPIVTKDIDNITQASVTNLNSEPCKLPYLCRYVWNVEALSKEVVQGKNKSYGVSEATAFSILVQQPGGCFELDTTQYKIQCIGQNANGKFVFRISNLYIKNINTNTGACTGNSGTSLTNQANYVNTQTPGSYTISNVTPSTIPVINVGTPQSFSFDVEANSAIPGSFFLELAFYSQCIGAAGISKCPVTIPVNFDNLPSCICTACDSIQIKLGQKYLSQNGNNVDIVQTITTLFTPANTPLKIKSLTAEIIYLDIIKDAKECYQCEKNSDHLGKFLLTSTSLAGFINTSSLPGDEIVYNAATAKALGNTPFKFTISAPELNKCCNDTVNVCLRYSIVTEDCKTCSVTQCYQLPRTK